MPIFNDFGPLAIQAAGGDTINLFTASDVVAPGNNSRVIALLDAGPDSRQAISFQIVFATAPTAVVEIFGSNFPPTSAGPVNGIVLFTSTNTQNASYTDNSSFRFYWAQLVSQTAGGALQVLAHVN